MRNIYNWNKTISSIPEFIYKPKTIDELKNIVNKAKMEGMAVRVTGGVRHTWGGLSMSSEIAVSMEHFCKVRSVDVDKKTVTVESGVTLKDLNKILFKRELSLSNMGGIDAQSIGGVISTATHGSSIHHGTFSDELLEMEILTASGEVKTLNVQSDGFDAFKTSLGSMGIVISATLKCEELFYIQQKTEKADEKWKDITNIKIRELAEENYFFQITIDPHSGTLVYTKRAKILRDKNIDKKSFLYNMHSALAKVLQTAGLVFVEYIILPLQKFLPVLTRFFIWLSLRLMKGKSFEASHNALVVGHLDKMGLYVNRSFQDQEYAVSIGSTVEAVNRVLEVFNKYVKRKHAPIVLELRFVGKSSAYMSPSYGRDTCFIDVLLFDNDFTKWHDLVRGIETALLDIGGRPHWGKNNFLTHKIIMKNKLYPKLDEFLRIKHLHDPDNLFSNEYMNNILFGFNDKKS